MSLSRSDSSIATRIAGLSPERRALVERLLREKREGGQQDKISMPPLTRRDPSDLAPLSYAQERLWFLDRLTPGNPFYNVAVTLHLARNIDRPCLRRALNGVVRRHESLRTVFTERDGDPFQIVLPQLDLDLPVTTIAALDPEERGVEVARLASEETHASFNLQTGPLIRARLLDLDDQGSILILTVHHIVADGWSMGLLLREANLLYSAFAQGRNSPLADLPIQYGDYAAWQKRWLSGKRLAGHLEYWKRTLADLPQIQFPTDRPRPPIQSFRGAAVPIALPISITGPLQTLCRQNNCTLFMGLFAAFAALLGRYTGQQDIVVGVPTAGRSRAEIEGLIGFFLNTLVFRVDVSGDPSFKALLRRVRQVILEAGEHEAAPFERIVEELKPERDLSRNPLFQISFQLMKFADLPQTPKSGALPEIPPTRGTAIFDMSFNFSEGSDGVVAGQVDFATDLFDIGTMQRVARHYVTTIEAAVTHPDLALSEHPLIGSEEQDRMLVEWNRTAVPYPSELTVHQLLTAQAQRSLTSIAVQDRESELTYNDLQRRANRLAHWLQRRGAGNGCPIAVCLGRSSQLVVSLLAVLKAGAPYLPIDPAYPSGRIAWMLDDAAASLGITDEVCASVLPADSPTTWLRPDLAVNEIDSCPDTVPAAAVGPNDLAYIIYTSGSTGRPKGVMVQHNSFVNFLTAMQRVLGLDSECVLLAITTISFDIAGLELFVPLSVGGRVTVAEREEAEDGAQLSARLARSGATMMQATPTTWRMLRENGWVGDARLTVLSGGEAITSDLVEWLLRRCRSVWNLYGPTETTVWSTAHCFTMGAPEVVVGRPLPNTCVYVLDQRLRPAPIGLRGELFIGGDGVARGYLNRSELTAERFLADPFSSVPRARMYRTGDVARLRPDGSLQILGRVDDQIKIRGRRVEPGEIEAVLHAHETVQAAVVVARPVSDGDLRLVACVVPKVESRIIVSDIRTYLRGRLPEVMIPSAFAILEQLPRTPNGKVDRRALSMVTEVALAQTEYVAPRSPREEWLAALWAELLSAPQVGIHDNFFDLGGHSLLATRFVARLRDRLGVELPLRDIFETPTIAELAARLASAPAPARQEAPGLNDMYDEGEI
jgi:amino acid adenylation domain-containing protein